MEACTSTNRVILPLRAAPARSAAAGAVACSRNRAGTRGRIRLATARASLDRAAVLLDAAVGTGYSQASYYTSLGLFVLSVPGLWSLIKRSVKSKFAGKSYSSSEKTNVLNRTPDVNCLQFTGRMNSPREKKIPCFGSPSRFSVCAMYKASSNYSSSSQDSKVSQGFASLKGSISFEGDGRIISLSAI